MSRRWLVLDMDDGLLRRAATRRAALAWWMDLNDTSVVVRRYSSMAGAYNYVTASAGDPDDSCGGVFIEHEDVAARGGWDPEQVPLYPRDEEPFTRVPREP